MRLFESFRPWLLLQSPENITVETMRGPAPATSLELTYKSSYPSVIDLSNLVSHTLQTRLSKSAYGGFD